jgi:hypothetical protein
LLLLRESARRRLREEQQRKAERETSAHQWRLHADILRNKGARA